MDFIKILRKDLLKTLPREVEKLFTIFGDDIRLVGGCVRDLMLGKPVNDFDFATTFLPDEIEEILAKNKIKSILVGKKFGCIVAVINKKNFEITTLRKDVETDGRHAKVEFVDDYYFDASRRDFSINALYLDRQGNVYDYFSGIEDLKNKKVKFIGDANLRIEEDYLRILRFFRFSLRYSNSLDEDGLKYSILNKEGLKSLSRERIRAELLKIISHDDSSRVLEILEIINQKLIDSLFLTKFDINTLRNLFAIKIELREQNLLLALFYKNIQDFSGFFKEICATRAEKDLFSFIEKNLANISHETRKIKELIVFHNKHLVLDLYLYYACSNFKNEDLEVINKNIELIEDFVIPEFPLQSSDIIDLGFSGSQIGIVQKKAKKFWVQNDCNPKKEEIINMIIDIYQLGN